MPNRKSHQKSTPKKNASEAAIDPTVEKFLEAFDSALAATGITLQSLQGTSAVLTNRAGQSVNVNLKTVFQKVADQDQTEWPRLIAEDLKIVEPAAMDRSRAIRERGLGANADNLLPALKPLRSVRGSFVWFEPLVEPDPSAAMVSRLLDPTATEEGSFQSGAFGNESDPCLLLGIDSPERIMYVAHETMDQAGEPASVWVERALRNLERSTPSTWCEVLDEEDDVRWVTVHDNYDASRALILDRLLPGVAENGWFVAPVGRDNLYFMPATELAVHDAVLRAHRMAGKEYEETPYQISDQIYWIYRGRWYHFAIATDEAGLVVTPPTEFCRVFGV